MQTTRQRRTRNSYMRRNGENNKISYIEGNVVRKMDIADYDFDKPVELKKADNRNKKILGSISLRNTLFMSIAIVMMVGILTMYLGVRSEIAQKQHEVARLQTELNDKKLANDEEYARIMGSVDLEEIKTIAMEELGMTYPNSEQIVAFADNDSDYVRQYKDLSDN